MMIKNPYIQKDLEESIARAQSVLVTVMSSGVKEDIQGQFYWDI